jgi:ElaB/YqjD/DUF883 family membrane-anchored ribosome-binding protein
MDGTATTRTATASAENQYSGQRLFNLLGNLRQDLTDMIKAEIDLLKSEITSSISAMGKDGVLILMGGFIAYTGAVFALIGIAALIAFALNKAGLSLAMATWISFLAFGLAIAGTGFGILKSGISKFKNTPVAPKQTIATVKEIAKSTNGGGLVATADLKTPGGEKIQKARAAAEKKIEKVQSELAEVQARMKPKYLWNATCTAVKRRPKASAGVGAAVIALGYMMMKRRKHHRNGQATVDTYEIY